MSDEHTATINELQISLMRSQEEVARLRKAIQKIEDTIVDESKMPSYHNQVIARHRLEWGSLHNAIDHALNVLHGKHSG